MTIILNTAQQTQIDALGGAGNYPAMYRYIADEIKANRIAVEGGTTSKLYYWFDQAASINANNLNSPSTLFIRAAANYGLLADHLPAGQAVIDNISNTIGANVLTQIKNKGELPDLPDLLQSDIGGAISKGGITLGGWGGAFFFWDVAYRDPQSNTLTTVGGYIQSHPADLEKFYAVNSQAITDTVMRFGGSLLTDPAVQDAAAGGFKNLPLMVSAKLLFSTKAEMEARGLQAAVSGVEDAVANAAKLMNDFQQIILRVAGYRLSFSQADDPSLTVADAASTLFVSDVFGGSEDDASVALADSVKAKLEALLLGKDTTGAVVYEIPGQVTNQEQLGAASVFITLRSGETVAIAGDGSVSYYLKTSDDDGNTLWTTQNFDQSYSTNLLGANGNVEIRNYNAQGSITQTSLTERQADNSLLTTVRDGQGFTLSTTNLQTFDDGSRLETTTLANGDVIATSFDADNQLAGTITDTPDGVGGMNRAIDTMVDGKAVHIEQHADATALANGEQAGDFDSTAISIGDSDAMNSDLIEDAMDSAYQSASDILRARGSGQLTQLLAAADPGDLGGWQPVTTSGEQAWYETAQAQQLGGVLTDVQGLIAAMKSGKPLPIATLVFSLAATVSRNPEISGISQGLGTLNSLSNFTDALQRGDELAALSSGASFVNNVYTEFFKNIIDQQLLTRAGIDLAADVTAAEYKQAVDAALVHVTDLGAMGDEAAASLAQTAQVFQNLAQALPYLNLINAVANGDTAGTAVAIAAIAGVPYIGWAYAAYTILTSLFSDPPDVHGSAIASSSQDGRHVVASITDTSEGGGNTAGSVMTNLIAGLESTFADTTAMGIIAQRLPSLYFKGYSGGGSIKNQTTPEVIAVYAQETVARSLFVLRIRSAANNGVWKVAA